MHPLLFLTLQMTAVRHEPADQDYVPPAVPPPARGTRTGVAPARVLRPALIGCRA